MVSLTTLPAALSWRIMSLLPVADRVRAGGVSPAWRAVAHAPALYGPTLKLSAALDAPRTVADAALPAAAARFKERCAADELRCSALFVLRSLAALAAGTLTRLDVRMTRRDTDTPEKLLAEAIVSIAGANPGLTEVLTDAPTALPACLQLLARCPRVAALTVSSLAVTPAALCALRGDAAALSARLTLALLDLGRDTHDVDGYSYEQISFFGALTTARAAAQAAPLATTLAAVGAGAWHVRELHLPGCKTNDAVLVSLLQTLTASAQPACGVERLVLHYSFEEPQRAMSASAGAALAAAANALPALRSITFSDEGNPTQGEYDDEDYIGAGELDQYLLEKPAEEGEPLTPGGEALTAALAPREPPLPLLYGGECSKYAYGGRVHQLAH